MITQQEKSQVTRTISKIKDILEEVSSNPDDYDLLKTACEIFNEVLLSQTTCPFCGCDKMVEAEVFSNDKLFTGHNCRGTILAGRKE